MFWQIILFLALLIPILAIVLDSQVGRALASRLERRSLGEPEDLVGERLGYLEGEVERGGTGGKRCGVRDADDRAELLLEGIHLGPKGGYPIRLEGLPEQVELLVTHVRRRQVETRAHPRSIRDLRVIAGVPRGRRRR